MYLKWMGEYRDVVEQLIHYCNVYASVYKNEMHIDNVSYSFSQIQVVEYLLENEDLNQNMTTIAARLGITNSNFSKLVNKLEQKGLLEKYHVAGNRKNIVIRVSDLGREVYQSYSKKIYERHFSAMFDVLKTIPQEYLGTFAKALSSPWNIVPPQKDVEEAPSLLPVKCTHEAKAGSSK